MDAVMQQRQRHTATLLEEKRLACAKLEQQLQSERQTSEQLEATTRSLKRALTKANGQVEVSSCCVWETKKK